MFAFLRGVVARKPATHIELDVNGVGYEVNVSDRARAHLGEGQTTTLLTYCHIREDTFQIFGFLREEEKALFTMLLGISGVGPRVALAIVSALSPAEFGQAISSNDISAFTKVGGVGKKTAQRLVLELSAKLGHDAALDKILGTEFDEGDLDSDDVIAALMAMGCSQPEARKAAVHARDALGADATDEDLVKAALQSLAKV